MLVFTGKYWAGCFYLNNCVHALESFLYLKLYNTMILVNTGMGDKYSTFRVRYISSGAQASLVCKYYKWLRTQRCFVFLFCCLE